MDFIFIFSVRSIKLGKSARAYLDERTRPGKAGIVRGAQLGITGLGAARKLSVRAPSTNPSSGLKPAHVGSSSSPPSSSFPLPFPFPFTFQFSLSVLHFPISCFIFPLRFQFSISIYSFPFLPSLFFFFLRNRCSGPCSTACRPKSVPVTSPPRAKATSPFRGAGERWDTRGETRGQIFGVDRDNQALGRGTGGRTEQATGGSGLLGTPGTDASRGGWHSQMCAQGVARGQPDVRGRRWALATCRAAGRALGTGCGGEGVTLGTGRVTPVAGVTPGRRCHPGAGGR